MLTRYSLLYETGTRPRVSVLLVSRPRRDRGSRQSVDCKCMSQKITAHHVVLIEGKGSPTMSNRVKHFADISISFAVITQGKALISYKMSHLTWSLPTLNFMCQNMALFRKWPLITPSYWVSPAKTVWILPHFNGEYWVLVLPIHIVIHSHT